MPQNFIDQLATYGLTTEDATRLGIEFLDASTAASLWPGARSYAALKLNYYDTSGNAVIDQNTGRPFFRLRYINAGPDAPRYVQAPGSIPAAYFPRNVDWSKIADDIDTPIIITEGEAKAARACKDNFPTIGLGGVFNFASKKDATAWIPSLDLVQWSGRNVYIIFDSDLKANKNVAIALRRLTTILKAKNSIVHVVFLPDVPGLKKTGLDDFLNAKGKDALLDLLSKADKLNNIDALLRLNDEYCHVTSLRAVYVFATKELIPLETFKTMEDISEEYIEMTPTANGGLVPKAIPIIEKWLRWKNHEYVYGICFKPGAEQFVDLEPSATGRVRRTLNLWTGWGVEPVEGDVTPFLTLVHHVFSLMEPWAERYFLQWLAYPLQHPGTKLPVATIIQSKTQGLGKTLIGETIGRIYGDTYASVENSELHSQFNDWLLHKCFAHGDEITSSDKRHELNVLKNLVTRSKVLIKQKFLRAFYIDDCVNYFFTSNYADALFLDDEDRRFFVVNADVEKLPRSFYRDVYRPWLNGNGPAALLHYLLNYDTSDFDPTAEAPKTRAKVTMTRLAESSVTAWLRSAIEEPEIALQVVADGVNTNCDLYTAADLAILYAAANRSAKAITSHIIGKELKRLGVKQVYDGNAVQVKNRAGRYYALRNVDKWMSASHAEIVEHIEAVYESRYKKF